MQKSKKINPAIAAIIVIVLIGLIAAAVVAVRNQSYSSTVADTNQATEQQQPATSSSTNTLSSGTYTDGTYTETGVYISPGGRESVEVTVTLAGNVIDEVSVKADAASGDSREYQNEFISNYKKLVVGKNIDEVSLSRVAGSSLTSNGFNSAIELIKADAKA